MGTGVRDKYSVAINGKGYMLRGSPNNPAYRRDEQPTAISRLALSDLQYSDFSGSGNFFTAQTDWSAGIKSDKVWKDDAKFYYSTNIDTFSEQGAFKLHKQLTSENAMGAQVYHGERCTVKGVNLPYVGTYDNVSGYPTILRQNSPGSWTTVASNDFGTSQNQVARVSGHKDYLWASIIGAGNNWVVAKWQTGGSWTDHSAAIKTALGWSALASSHSHCSDGTTFYASVIGGVSDPNTAIVSTVDNGANWVVEKTFAGANSIIYDMVIFLGNVYYLMSVSGATEFHVFNPIDSTDTVVETFYGGIFTNGCAGRYLKVLGGSKLIITIPSNSIYSFDGSTLTRIFVRDPAKIALGIQADVSLGEGGCIVDTSIYWGNLVYDGTVFHNWKKDSTDDASSHYIPIFADNSLNIYGVTQNDRTALLKDDTTYKGTLAKNFLVFSEMSPVVAIDKLLVSITLVFDALATNENLAVEYSINGGSSWTALTTMTPTTEGSNTSRTFVISNPTTNVIYKKLFVRVKMAGSATTPVVRDVIVGYKPIPDYKNRWSMRLDMSDGIKLLSGQNDERKGIELYSELWNEKVTKQIVNLEDIDYVECSIVSGMTASQTSALVNRTRNFPRRGRIRAVSGGVVEEMIYTSADSNKIRGISRGQRGTRARAYSAGQQLDSAYSVYLERMQSEINWTDENKSEHVATVTLLEA